MGEGAAMIKRVENVPPPIPDGWCEVRNATQDTVIRYRVESHRVEFKVRTGCLQNDGRMVYDMENDTTEEFDRGERLVDGTVKWDGCSHMYFGAEGDTGYIHLCGAERFRNIIWALHQMTQIAAREMPKYYDDCAHFSTLGDLVRDT